LKQHLEGFLFHNNEEVEVAVGGSLRMQEPGFYRDGIFQLVPKWEKLMWVLRGPCCKIVVIQWN